MKKILSLLILMLALISCVWNQDVLDTNVEDNISTEDNISKDELKTENIIEEEKEIENDIVAVSEPNSTINNNTGSLVEEMVTSGLREYNLDGSLF